VGLQTSAQARYAFVRRLVADRLPVGSRLVEFGAAPGDQCVALAEAGYRVTAVDLGLSSDAWADAPEGRMVDLFERHGVDYVEWDLERTPYPLAGAAYDGVIFTEVFEHLRDYPVRALEEAARVLRPGGFLFFTTPNAGYLVNRVRLATGRSVYTALPDWIGGVPHARHAREYLVGEIVEVLGVAGLRPVLVTGRHFHLTGGSPLKRAAKRGIDLLARVRPTLGPMVVAVAEKPPAS